MDPQTQPSILQLTRASSVHLTRRAATNASAAELAPGAVMPQLQLTASNDSILQTVPTGELALADSLDTISSGTSYSAHAGPAAERLSYISFGGWVCAVDCSSAEDCVADKSRISSNSQQNRGQGSTAVVAEAESPVACGTVECQADAPPATAAAAAAAAAVAAAPEAAVTMQKRTVKRFFRWLGSTTAKGTFKLLPSFHKLNSSSSSSSSKAACVSSQVGLAACSSSAPASAAAAMAGESLLQDSSSSSSSSNPTAFHSAASQQGPHCSPSTSDGAILLQAAGATSAASSMAVAATVPVPVAVAAAEASQAPPQAPAAAAGAPAPSAKPFAVVPARITGMVVAEVVLPLALSAHKSLHKSPGQRLGSGGGRRFIENLSLRGGRH